MKKYLLTILLGAFGMMFFSASVLAATSISFTPVNVSVRQGQSFTLTIGINPRGVKNYTIKTELHYPADILEVKSFTFARNWMPLAQPGYDLIDNANGVLIKTAGYPGGVSSAVTFGTVSFLSKKSGNGTITLKSGSSLALDANSQNIIADVSVQTAVVILPAPAPIPTAPKTPTIPTIPTIPRIPAVEPVEETPVIPEPIIAPQPIAPQPIAPQPRTPRFLLASIYSALTLGTNSVFVGILIIIVILTLVGYAIFTAIRRARRKNLGKPR
jgi:hypothetical protein